MVGLIHAAATSPWHRGDPQDRSRKICEGFGWVCKAAKPMVLRKKSMLWSHGRTRFQLVRFGLPNLPGDGTRVLRFTNFKTPNGPDVHVLMVASDDAKDGARVLYAGFIDVGSRQANIGDQNHAPGPEADSSKYRAVTIGCKRSSVNFGTPPRGCPIRRSCRARNRAVSDTHLREVPPFTGAGLDL